MLINAVIKNVEIHLTTFFKWEEEKRECGDVNTINSFIGSVFLSHTPFFNVSLCPFPQLLSNRRQPPEEVREEEKKDDLTVFHSCLYQCLVFKPPWSKKVYLKGNLCPALLGRT